MPRKTKAAQFVPMVQPNSWDSTLLEHTKELKWYVWHGAFSKGKSNLWKISQTENVKCLHN